MKSFKLRKGPFKGMTVVSAAQDRVTRLEPYVRRVLDALGHPEAYVTDDSMVGDFYSYDAADPKLAAEQLASLQAVSLKLGLPLAFEDLIADVAERLQGGQ